MIAKSERFTCADGTIAAVVYRFQKRQTRAYSLGGLDTTSSFARRLAAANTWNDMTWPITQDAGSAAYNNGKNALFCRADELDEESNEFGLISP